MKKSVVWLLAGVLIAVGLGAAAAHEQAGQVVRDTPLGRLVQGQVGRWLVLWSELKITGEQRAQIRQIVVAHKQQLAEVAAGLVEQKRALRDVALVPDARESDIRDAASRMTDRIADAAILLSAMRGEIFKVLDSRQQDLLEKALSDRQDAVDRWLTEMAKP
jgi:Spy/CpxP family protein refolding chaperone